MTPQLRFPEFTDRWQTKRVSSLFEITRGLVLAIDKTKPKRNHENIYPVYSSQTKHNGLMGYYSDYLYEDAITWTTDGANAGEVQYRQGKFYCTNVCGVLKSNRGYANKTIAELLNRITHKYVSYVGNPKLMNNVMGSISINIPSVKEQEKIAEFLTAVDGRIGKIEKKLELLQRYKKGVMQKIFTQQIRFKDESGKLYPEWEEKTLGDIGEVVTGKTPSTSDASKWNGDILFVTPTDIKNEKYQYTSERTVSASAVSKVLPTKSIMYTCIASIGKMSLSTRQTTTNQQINSLIPHKSYDNEFVYYGLLWLTPKIISTQSNNTLPIINKTEFSKFKLSTPPYGEQQKIATFLTALDDKIKVEQTRLNSAKQWKKGLLHRMFV